MSCKRKYITAFVLVSLLLLAETASADFYQNCQTYHKGNFTFRSCEGGVAPGPWGPGSWGPPNPWGPYYQRCWVKMTPWGPVQKCRFYGP